MKSRIKLCVCLFFVCSFSYGQMDEYAYKREIKGVSEQWHKIVLPTEIFGKTTQKLADIRIFGITENDTIEAPFRLRVASEKISSKKIEFNKLNTSHIGEDYFFTFEIPAEEPINQIKLDFAQENFDWQISLEGSQDLNEWFHILEVYRILSIKNDLTDFQFTTLTFPNSKYRYFRVGIHSKEKPELNSASISQEEIKEGKFKKYVVKKFNTKDNPQTKQTEIEVELKMPVRASHVKIGILDTFDYYRPITIQYLTDSIKTEQGWKYNYSTLTSGTLNSIEENEFEFNSTTVKKLKIFIGNQDNKALKIKNVVVKGYVHELTTRFTDKATYFLVYGNKSATKPSYDIERFADNIPETLTSLTLGNEQKIPKKDNPKPSPLFENKAWLWAIMGAIILLLGWFSVKMMRKSR